MVQQGWTEEQSTTNNYLQLNIFTGMGKLYKLRNILAMVRPKSDRDTRAIAL